MSELFGNHIVGFNWCRRRLICRFVSLILNCPFLFSDIHSMVQFTSQEGRHTNRKHRGGLSKWLEIDVIT